MDDSAPEPMQHLDPDGLTEQVLAVYGGTMLEIQCLENVVSLLYLMLNFERDFRDDSKGVRSWQEAFTVFWNAFQKGSPGMKLNDPNRGLKGRIPDDLHHDLSRFFRVQRNQLAHRFLFERVRASADGGSRFATGSTAELLETAFKARDLNKRVTALTDSTVKSMSERFDLSDDDHDEFGERFARLVQLKQIPADAIMQTPSED